MSVRHWFQIWSIFSHLDSCWYSISRCTKCNNNHFLAHAITITKVLNKILDQLAKYLHRFVNFAKCTKINCSNRECFDSTISRKKSGLDSLWIYLKSRDTAKIKHQQSCIPLQSPSTTNEAPKSSFLSQSMNCLLFLKIICLNPNVMRTLSNTSAYLNAIFTSTFHNLTWKLLFQTVLLFTN